MVISKKAYLILGVLVFLSVLVGSNEVSAQLQNGISEPVPGDTISGIVLIRGTATDPNFLRYELAFRHTANADWIVFAQGDRSVIDDTLAVWDTTVGREADPVFPDGVYQLRLRVVRTDYNYDEFFVSNIIVSNEEPTPTPTPGEDEVTLTPAPGGDQQGILQPTAGPLPTLTPFPTPQPRATPAEAFSRDSSQPEQDPEQNSEGVLDQLSNIDTNSFGRAFWRGALLVALAFAGLATYLLLRGVFRRFWRFVQAKIFR